MSTTATPEDIANVCKLLERLRTGEMNLIPGIASLSERKEDASTALLQRVEAVLSAHLRRMQEPQAQPAAFPSDYTVEGHRYINEGLTFRDYFAAKAMQGLIANGVIFERYGFDKDLAGEAEFSYQVADAMLKAREA